MRLITLLLLLIGAYLPAQVEIQPLKNFAPDNIDFRAKSRGVAFDGKLFFPATTTEEGAELWMSDGTPEGTQLLVDLFVGPGSSFPQSLFVANGVLYFVATTPASGFELYKTDGTLEGTTLVKDILPGTDSSLGTTSIGNRFYAWRDRVYFAAEDFPGNLELWSTDGTTEGTQLEVDLLFDASPVFNRGSEPANLVANEHFLYFTAGDRSVQTEVWRFDGDTAVQVSDISIQLFSVSPSNLTVLGDYVYFGAGRGFEFDLYRSLATPGSDPTPELVFDFQGGGLSLSVGSPGPFKIFDGSFIFPARQNLNVDLYISDGTASGTRLLFDNDSDVTSDLYQPNALTFSGSNLFYADRTPNSGFELWKTDGTSEGTVQITDLNEGPASAFNRPFYFHNHLDRLYFAANGTVDGSSELTGTELYTSLGSKATTFLVADLFEGQQSSSPYHFVSVDEKLFFFANTTIDDVQLFVLSGAPSPLSLSVTIDSTRNLICNGDTNGSAAITVCGGTPPYTLDEIVSETGQFLIPGLPGGASTFTITDSGDSSAVILVEITQPDELELVATQLTGQNSIEGGAITLDLQGGTSPYNLSWADTTLTSNTRENLEFGTYFATLTDANDCMTVDSFVIEDLTSVYELSRESFTIYPTLATEEVRVELTNRQIIDRVECHNLAGQLVSTTNSQGQSVVTLNATNLPKKSGIYLISIWTQNGKRGLGRIVIKR